MNDGFRVEGSIRIPLKKKREKRFQDKRFSPKKLSCDGDHSRRHMKGSSLELELQTQAQAGRELEDRARAIERIRNRSHTRDTAIDLERFVQTNRALVVEDITLRINSGISGANNIQFFNPFYGEGLVFQFPSSLRLGMKFQF